MHALWRASDELSWTGLSSVQPHPISVTTNKSSFALRLELSTTARFLLCSRPAGISLSSLDMRVHDGTVAFEPTCASDSPTSSRSSDLIPKSAPSATLQTRLISGISGSRG